MPVSINGSGAITFNDGSIQNTSAFFGGLAFRNRIINGAMMIDQRNAGASLTPTNTLAATYSVDRWATYGSVGSRFSIQRNAGSVTPPSGFTNYLGVTSLAATTASAGELYYVYQPIEGFNFADLGFGSANASAITVSFWVRSSLTGTFSGSITNGAYNRAYPFSYIINAANTWEYKTVTITGDTTGTWATDNSTGANVFFNLGTGSTNLGTANAWTGSGRIGVTGSVNVLGTNGATFYITGVQLEKGSTATSFDYRPYGTELALCQRYYAKLTAGTGVYTAFGGGAGTTTYVDVYSKYPVTMRASPTVSQSSTRVSDATSGFAVTGIGTSYLGNDSALITVNATGLTQYRPYTWQANNSTSAFVDFSAEL